MSAMARPGVAGTTRLYGLFALLVVVTVAASFAGLVPLAAAALAVFASYLAVNSDYLRSACASVLCELGDSRIEVYGDEALLRLPISIGRFAGYGRITMYLDIPPHLSRTGKAYTHVAELSSGSQDAEVVLRRRAGMHLLGPLRISVADPLRLLECSTYVRESIVVRIPPRVGTAPIARWYGLLRTSSGARTLTPGHGVEYHSSREYQSGDEPRHIDWKATARLGKLYVKVFEVESPLRVAILVDAHSYAFVGSPRSLFEHCVDIAVSLSAYLLKRGDRVIIVTLSEDGVRSTGELRRASGLVEALRALSSVPWPRSVDVLRVEPPPLGRSLNALAELLRSASVAVLLLPVLSERRAVEVYELVKRIAGVGVEVVVIAPLVAFFSTASRLDDAVYRVLRFDILSRELRSLELLRRLGVRAMSLSPHKALERVIAELERMRVLRAR